MLWLAGLVLALPQMGQTHDALGAFVQHSVHLEVGAAHMDVTVDLTFFEEWSERERKAMDADGNGTVTRSEEEAYLKRIGPLVNGQLRLLVAGRESPLIPLYDPEIDLLGNRNVGPAHHRLRLVFFAATPANLRAGDELLVEDRLWPEARILATSRADGSDGGAIIKENSKESAFLPAQAGAAQAFKFKCVKPPSPPAPERGPSLPKSRDTAR